MTDRLRWFRGLALTGCCLALSCVDSRGQMLPPGAPVRSDSRREQKTEIPSATDAPVVKDGLLQAFRNRSALNRVELLEQIDASPAIEQPTAIAILQESLRDDDPLVREAALLALIRRDSEENPVLAEEDIASWHSEGAELARVHFASKHEDTAALQELIRNGDAVVQEGAFNALATRDAASAIEALRAELRDRSSLYRLQTLELLTRNVYTNSPDVLLPILSEVAGDQDPLVREYANQKLKEKKLQVVGNRSL